MATENEEGLRRVYINHNLHTLFEATLMAGQKTGHLFVVVAALAALAFPLTPALFRRTRPEALPR